MDQSIIMQNPGPVLETVNVFVFIGSFAFFLATVVFVAPAVLQKMFPQYASYPADKRAIMEDAFLGAVNGMILAPLGWYNLLFTDMPPRVLFFDHPLVRLEIALAAGYELVDLLRSVMIPVLRQPASIFHHCVIGYVMIVKMMYKCTPRCQNAGFIGMATNVFLSTSIILNCVGKGNTKLAIWNWVVFAVVFFHVRIWLLGVEWWHGYHIVLQPEFANIPFPVLLADIPCSLIFTVLYVVWFYKICRIAWKMMTKKGKLD